MILDWSGLLLGDFRRVEDRLREKAIGEQLDGLYGEELKRWHYNKQRVRYDFVAHRNTTTFDDAALGLFIVVPRLRNRVDLPWENLDGGWTRFKVCNQGILVQDTPNFGLKFAGEDIFGPSSYFEFGVYGVVNFRKHPDCLTVSRDALVETPQLRNLQRRVRLAVLDTVREIAKKISVTAGVDIEPKRAYLFHLLVKRLSSGYVRRSGNVASTRYWPKGAHQMRFSMDADMPRAIYTAYGKYYPVGLKGGTSAEFVTLATLLQRPGLTGINCCMPDIFYPNFNGWYDLERDGQVTIVLDEAREFDLVERFVQAAEAAPPVRFWSGWDMCRAAGARVVSVPPAVGRLLPSRAALVEASWMSDDVLVRTTDAHLTYLRDVSEPVRPFVEPDDVLYMVNARSWLGRCCGERELHEVKLP